MRRFWTNWALSSPKFWRQSNGVSTASAWIKCRSTWPAMVEVAATPSSDPAPAYRSFALTSLRTTIEATWATLHWKIRLSNRLALRGTPWKCSFSLPSNPTLARQICSIAPTRALQTTTTKRWSCKLTSLLSRNTVVVTWPTQELVSQHWLLHPRMPIRPM